MAGAFLLLIAIFVLTGYDGSFGRPGPSEPAVKDMELPQLLDRRGASGRGADNIVEEDERFIYEVSLKSLILEDMHKTSVITGG